MNPYPAEVCQHMKAFYDSLTEKDRRRYAAVEAEKLRHEGVEYVSQVLGCDEKTVRHRRRLGGVLQTSSKIGPKSREECELATGRTRSGRICPLFK